MRRILILLTALGGCGLTMATAADPVPAPAASGQPAPLPAPTAVSSAPAYAEPYASDAPADGKHKTRFREWLAFHRREPSGIPTPVGSGNAWTEFKYAFGSSRQFFGTADSSVGVWNHATVPPPYRDR